MEITKKPETYAVIDIPEEYQVIHTDTYSNPDTKIKEAIKLLRQNDYTVFKLSKAQEIDSDECAAIGDKKDCDECSCRICVFQDI